MQRAIQQARAEAAAQAQDASQPAPAGSAASTDAFTTQAQSTSGKDKRALGALLRRAAQKMQQETTDTAGAEPKDKLSHGSEPNQELGAHKTVEHPTDPGQDPLDIAGISLDGLGGQMIATSSTELSANDGQPHKGPSRGPSLGEKLGSILRNALSLPKPSKYDPISGEDDDAVERVEGHVDGALRDGNTKRALPRDASYLPEWLNSTLEKASSSSARASSVVSRADSDLPEWVDVASLQQQEGRSENTCDKTEPLQMDLQQPHHQQGFDFELLARTLKPVPRPAPPPDPPRPLITAPSWPPPEDEDSAVALKESRGKRLLAFWQQQQPTAAAPPAKAAQSSAMLQPLPTAALEQKPAVNQTPAHAVHARCRIQPEPDLQLDVIGQPEHLLAATGIVKHTHLHCIQLAFHEPG